MRIATGFLLLTLIAGSALTAADAPTKWDRNNIPKIVTQYDDGVIVFPVQASRIENPAAETFNENWQYKATRWGKYQVVLITPGITKKSDIKVNIGTHQFTKTITQPLFPDRAGRLRHEIALGTVYLAKAGPLDVHLTTTAAFRPRLLMLKPAAEGKLVTQNKQNNEIHLHSRDATVLGTILRYEPKPEKNTLGYWINAKDRAYWEFDLKQPGEYQVEILQGCGKGQGGSDIYFELKQIGIHAEKEKTQQLPWTVIDTGHFQNFKPYGLGTFQLMQQGAKYRITVHVKNKKNKAVMDLRKVILKPVKKTKLNH